MAKNGVRFTSGYVTCPVCSPSRAALITGKYQQRFGHENNIAQSWELQHAELMGLPVEEKTIADRLKAAGYRTAAVGKWHLGAHANFQPLHRGFDEFFGFLEGGRAYLSDDDPANYFVSSLPPHKQVHFKEGAMRPSIATAKSSPKSSTSPTPLPARQSVSSTLIATGRSSSTWPITPCIRPLRPATAGKRNLPPSTIPCAAPWPR